MFVRHLDGSHLHAPGHRVGTTGFDPLAAFGNESHSLRSGREGLQRLKRPRPVRFEWFDLNGSFWLGGHETQNELVGWFA